MAQQGTKNARIAIVGGGIAGIAAAIELKKQNFTDVSIYEASDRLGGRINPVLYDNTVIELGAQFIHGRANPIYKMAIDLDIIAPDNKQENSPSAEEKYFTQNGCELSGDLVQLIIKQIGRIGDKVSSKTNKGRAKESYGQLLAVEIQAAVQNSQLTGDRLAQFRSAMDLMTKSIGGENGCADVNKMSVRQDYEYEEKPKEEEIVLDKLGYKTILDFLTRQLPFGSVKLNSQVSTIAYNSGQSVQISFTNGQTAVVDHVIVTPSIGFLKENVDRMFIPPLPRKKLAAIKTLGYDTLDKVFLIYDQPFWQRNLMTVNFIRTSAEDTQRCSFNSQAESPETTMFDTFDVHPWMPGTLIAWIRGSDPALMESLSEATLSAAATTTLRRFLNNPNIPPPRTVVKTTWGSNPLFRGSYSYYSTDSDKSGVWRSDLAEPILNLQGMPVVMFAGEATHDTNFQTTHGAYLSGIREATRINKKYQKNANTAASG